MRSTLKFLVALIAAFMVMLAFRALVFTIYTVEGADMAPLFRNGDRVMVNRWSYGLRTGGTGIFSYGRIARQAVDRDDVIAVDDSLGHVLLCRCMAQPSDTVSMEGRTIIVPGTATCAHQDYYCVRPLGSNTKTMLLPEKYIIGRAFLIIYSHQKDKPFWTGYDTQRRLLPI